jgi:hypothetical protein
MTAVAQRFGGPPAGVDTDADDDEERDEDATDSPCR